MRGLLISCISVLSAVAMSAPAIADEAPAKPKRERAAAPQRAAPAQQQASNWSGGQVGGSNGVSSVNNNFVEPGAYVCPFGSSLRQQLLRDAVPVQRAQGRLHHRPVCRLPRAVGELGRRSRRRLVLQEQRDLVEPVVVDVDLFARHGGSVFSTTTCEPTSSPAPSSRNRIPRSAPAWARSSRPGACCT